MATEPVTLFAETKNPALVVAVLRQLHALFTIAGTDDAWSEIVVTTGAAPQQKRLRISHDPGYYSGEGWQRQMNGMRGYFSRFPQTPDQAGVLALTERFGFALGTSCDPDAEAGDERYDILAAIAVALDAVWFTPSSLRDAQGRVLYGADVAERDPQARWPAYAPIAPQDSMALEALALKERVFDELASLGFQPADSLPLPDLDLRLRDVHTLCTRLMALQAVFAWAAMPEHVGATAAVQEYIRRNDLRASMTDSERAIVDLPREQSQSLHGNTVGWRLENMLALAWILGFEHAPDLAASQISGDVIDDMLFDFLPGWEHDASEFAAVVPLRPASAVIGMEYRFYCAHNAVRSAQMGGTTVPAGFDPIVHGGAVHERRHALTWALAPGDDWDDTDLST